MISLFFTGISGFIGRHLIRKLNPTDYKNIYLLSRTACNGMSYLRKFDNVHFLRGGLFDGESYIQYLSKSDIVIHLAAITGKAKKEEYFNINSKGTDYLVKRCKQSGVRKILYISTIATKFSDTKNYPYAQSKLQAEECVKSSGLLYTILRPTMVIGDESPILLSLSKLGNSPIVPIFGDGSTMIQPIFIEDLISQIIHIIKSNLFNNETLELGGPEQISISNFIKIIHKIIYKKNPRFIHLPIHPVVKILELMGKYIFSFLPFTAGQLSSFSNNGTIRRNWLFDRYLPNMKNVDEMLRYSLSAFIKNFKLKKRINQECVKFTEYLVNCKPNAYIEKKYFEGNRYNYIENNISFFDTFLIKVAISNTLMIRLADIYTSIFYRKAVFRKKLVLLLAILESCPFTHSKIDSITESPRLTFLGEIILKKLVLLL